LSTAAACRTSIHSFSTRHLQTYQQVGEVDANSYSNLLLSRDVIVTRKIIYIRMLVCLTEMLFCRSGLSARELGT
jgi:hypothetical protein